jgi:L-lactate dehydrogenase (cytochrome)
MPLILGPTGFTRMAHSQGELAVARAADRMRLPYTLSTLSTRSIEEVGKETQGVKWFQVYVWRDRALVAEMVKRAKASGYTGLMVTVDTAVLGRRERDVRRGFTLPPKIGLGTIIDGALHPNWTLDFLRHEPITFANVATRADKNGGTAVTLSSFINEQFDPALSWKDIEWLRDVWRGPLMIKGIQRVEDASLAVRHGVDGIMVSNHGGRQLDYAPASISILEEIVQEVDGRMKVICDGGIRRGSDIVKAVALGADACSIGRAYLYGLGAAGEIGVDRALSLLRDEMLRTMSLVGVRNVKEISRDIVTVRAKFM